MAPFPARRLADNFGAQAAALLDRQTWQSADDGLQLVVIGRLAGGDGQQRRKSSVGLGQMTYPAAAFGR